MRYLNRIFFILIITLNACTEKNEQTTTKKDSDNRLEVNKIVKLDTQLVLENELNKLQLIPNELRGTRESEKYLTTFKDLNENWTVKNGDNKIKIIEIHDWVCEIKDEYTLPVAGKLQNNSFQCTLPNFSATDPSKLSEKYINAVMFLYLKDASNISIYMDDSFKFSGKIKYFNASIGPLGNYNIAIHVDVYNISTITNN